MTVPDNVTPRQGQVRPRTWPSPVPCLGLATDLLILHSVTLTSSRSNIRDQAKPMFSIMQMTLCMLSLVWPWCWSSPLHVVTFVVPKLRNVGRICCPSRRTAIGAAVARVGICTWTSVKCWAGPDGGGSEHERSPRRTRVHRSRSPHFLPLSHHVAATL